MAFPLQDGKGLELEAKVNAIMNVLTGAKGKEEQEDKLSGLKDKKIMVVDINTAESGLVEAFKAEFSEKYLKQDKTLGELREKLAKVEEEAQQKRVEEQAR